MRVGEKSRGKCREHPGFSVFGTVTAAPSAVLTLPGDLQPPLPWIAVPKNVSLLSNPCGLASRAGAGWARCPPSWLPVPPVPLVGQDREPQAARGLQCSLEVLPLCPWLIDGKITCSGLRAADELLFSLETAGISQRIPHPSGSSGARMQESVPSRPGRRAGRRGRAPSTLKSARERPAVCPAPARTPQPLPLRLRRFGTLIVSLSVFLSPARSAAQPPRHEDTAADARPRALPAPAPRSCPAGLGFPPVPAPVTLPVPTGPAEPLAGGRGARAPCGAAAGHAHLGHGRLAEPRPRARLPAHGIAACSGLEGTHEDHHRLLCPCTASTPAMEPPPEVKRYVGFGRERDGVSHLLSLCHRWVCVRWE